MNTAGLTTLVDALEALGLAEGVARELAERGTLEPAMGRIRQVVREEIERAGAPGGGDRKGYLTVEQAARHAAVTPATVREWLTAEKLKGAKVGNRWRVSPGDLETFIQSQATGVEEPVDLDAEASRLLSLDLARQEKR